MNSRIALVSIARPTFDVPLAQAVADSAYKQLTDAGFDVVGAGTELLMDAEAAGRAIAALNSVDFDLLILLQASFADSSMAVEIAASVAKRRIPLLLWAVPDERDGGRLRLNSLCGINLAAHALARRRIGYDYLHVPADDPAALPKIERLARVGRAVRTLRGARVGLVGERPAGFDTCEYDAGDLAAIFGTEVVPFALDRLLARRGRCPGGAARPLR